MQPLYILLGGIILVMTLFAVPTIISDAKARRHK
jgi:hypothetical protein